MNVFKRTFGFIHEHPLAKNHLIKAYYNFFSWQIKSRLQRNLRPIKFIGETYFYAKKGLTGVTGNIYVGLHEFNDMGFLLHFLRKEDTFLDIGANVGSYTLLASGYVGANSIAFEPVPVTFNILSKNITLNQLSSKVVLLNIALGNKKGQLKFSSNLDAVNHVIAENEIEHETISVEVSTLNEFEGYKPSLLKIDVEGFETDVIKGGHDLLKSNQTKAIIIELNGSGGRYGYDEQKIHYYLLEIGYQPYQYNPFNRVLTPLSDFGSHNTIYIRDIDFVTTRCANASKFKILGVAI